MRNFLNQLFPFLLVGIALVALAFSIMLLAYLFLFGAILGLILFLVTWIRNTFFQKKTVPAKKRSGRIIDTDDWKKL